jgi:acyl-coenzyme A synthetase/AMP-(fatty) acid ligase
MRGRIRLEDILKTVEKYEVALLEVAATVLACILEDCDVDKQDLRSLLVCYTGGEPVSPALLEDYAKRGIAISQIYGQSETCTLTSLFMVGQKTMRRELREDYLAVLKHGG